MLLEIIPRTLVRLRFDQIHDSKWQPDTRAGNDQRYVELKQSIKKHGLLNPPMIDKNYELINGHRRVRAAKELGYTETFFEMLPFADDKAEIFIDINNTRPISGKDEFIIVMHGGKMSPRLKENLSRLENLYGSKSVLGEVYEHDLSPITVVRAHGELRDFIGNTSTISDKQIIDWILLNPSVSSIRRAMDTKPIIGVNILKALIKSSRPIPQIRESDYWNDAIQKQNQKNSPQMAMSTAS